MPTAAKESCSCHLMLALLIFCASSGQVSGVEGTCLEGTCASSFIQVKNVKKTVSDGWEADNSEKEDDEDHNVFDTKEAEDTEEEEEERSLLQTETKASFEAWKKKFHASLKLGDMCAHFKWDFGMVCRGPDGKANNNGGCFPPNYWDDGMDPSKPVHTGLTPCEANRCLGKPAGGRGNEPGMGQQAGWKPCSPPSNREEYQKAFAYGWKPPGENRTCVPICVNRKRGRAYRKVMCYTLPMVEYGKKLWEGSAHCKRPRRNCDFSDHTRDSFYRQAGFGKKCRENFNTTVYDTCAADPETPANCEVTAGGKKWNVLNTCWDGAWDKMCLTNKCFALKSLTDQKCVTTCKSYGGRSKDYGPYDECADAWAAAGCPADGVSYKKIDPCSNSTEPPSAAETAFGLWVAPGTRDETLGVRPPTTTTTTTTVDPNAPTTTTTTAPLVECTASCEQEFSNCFKWHSGRMTKEKAYSRCRGEIDTGFWRLANKGCTKFCLSTKQMCSNHKGCATTTAEPESTTATTTAEPESTTAEPESTTAEPESTTAEPESTTAESEPESTTAEPESTTAELNAATTTALDATTTATTLSQDQIAELGKAFEVMDANKDGVVTRDELKQLLKGLGEDVSPAA